MVEMIHVLKVTANAQDADGVDVDNRHSLIVFVNCEDEGGAYAPADAEAIEKLDESLQNAYREAESHNVAAVLLKSS
jgi:hypothetical protein